jgi:hypothetical protein
MRWGARVGRIRKWRTSRKARSGAHYELRSLTLRCRFVANGKYSRSKGCDLSKVKRAPFDMQGPMDRSSALKHRLRSSLQRTGFTRRRAWDAKGSLWHCELSERSTAEEPEHGSAKCTRDGQAGARAGQGSTGREPPGVHRHGAHVLAGREGRNLVGGSQRRLLSGCAGEVRAPRRRTTPSSRGRAKIKQLAPSSCRKGR